MAKRNVPLTLTGPERWHLFDTIEEAYNILVQVESGEVVTTHRLDKALVALVTGAQEGANSHDRRGRDFD